MKLGLTIRQAQLLEFIHWHISKYGYSPSYLEMTDGINIKGKSGIHRLVHGLKDRGHICMKARSPRSIELVA